MSSYFLFLILYYLIPIRKNQVFSNLKMAIPDNNSDWYFKTVKSCYKFFINGFFQFFAFPKSFAECDITVKGQSVLDDILKTGTGIIFVSGHAGAWEILSAWLGVQKYPVSIVATKQQNRGSDKFFQEQRGIFGMRHIYRKDSLDNMYAILEQNEILGLVSDQDAKNHGVFVDFFNMKSSTPKGAARFYIESGAPIIFTICYQTKPNIYSIDFRPIEIGNNATIESITQSFTSVLEEYVRKYPEQYFWFHRRWKTKMESK